jgi:hypothetical protein
MTDLLQSARFDQTIAVKTSGKKVQVAPLDTGHGKDLADLFMRFVGVDKDGVHGAQCMIHPLGAGQHRAILPGGHSSQPGRGRCMRIEERIESGHTQPFAQFAQSAFGQESIW